jgi:hypothetical protein
MAVRGAIEGHLGSGHVARVIYGAIIGLALVVSLESHPPSSAVMLATIVGTALAVSLAELYSDFVATETRTRQRIDRDSLRHIGDEAAFVAFGVAFPAIFFLLAAAGAMQVDTAFTVAKWSGLGLIGFYGFWAARLAGAGTGVCVIHALAVALVGGVLIALKALVH